MATYHEFLTRKSQMGADDGFAPTILPSWLFDFQAALVDYAVRRGRAALFADCGLGKTPMQLVWADNVVRHTNKPVLLLTPLAVAAQTMEEAAKFGIEAERSNGTPGRHITIANYDRLHHFNPDDYAGVVCDESSILKSFDGFTRQALTVFLRKVPYRLLCTATAAPNDYTELGTSSEALGYLGYMDMLNRFFKNDQNTSKPMLVRRFAKPTGAIDGDGKWRFKGHAEGQFWRWVSSWARALRRPSDLGFDDARFILPPLTETEHWTEAAEPPDGFLFTLPAVGLKEQRDERRRTIRERCEMAASLVADTGQPALMWCHLNEEGDRLADLVPDAVQVAGSDADEAKEEKFLAFAHGQSRVLITKPSIGAWGLNFQHCAHITTFPSHSFEQYYQGVRRCWRFGQTRPVTVDVIATEGDRGVLRNLQRKAAAADAMFSQLVAAMHDAMAVTSTYQPSAETEVPSWMS